MRKTIACSLAFCAIILGGALPVRADCVEDVNKFEASFNERLKTERVKAAAHPLILNMSDGRLVDMRGDDVEAKPTESWFVTDENKVDGVRSGITAAKEAFQSGDIAACESRYGELQTLLN